ncbi:histone lysine methyltransferase Set9 [Paraconiothyrium brasiliense]|uniref:Histone-lysine N-methyltransferase SET9 n=1 Tax=Paraconiothyrium brasiliense TaxID=300254 RepID=A0ABR3RL58_9PLEO
MAPKETAKKGALTLEKLALYDDILTDALVDKVYYWTAIRKNRGGRFSGSRGLNEEEIANILREHVVVEKNSAEAMQRLVQLPGLKKFLATLKDEADREHFKRHLRRYVSIYMPDCPFEVTTTNRYTITEHEASITARRDIQPREEIKYLTGVQVAMTEEQEKNLELARKDFSLVISARKKTRSLFLGPARFANHDCDANAKLSTKGYDGMQIVAVKSIKEGEEITVSYGEDYFGVDNEECLCHSCEDRMVNGWAPFRPVDDSSEDEDEDRNDDQEKEKEENLSLENEATPSRRRKRKHEESNDATDRVTGTCSKRRKPESDTKLPSFVRRKACGNATTQISNLKKSASTSSLRHELPVSSIEDPAANLPPTSRNLRTQQRDGFLSIVRDDDSSSRTTTPQSPADAASPKSTQSTDATSVDEDAPATGLNNPKIKVDPEIIYKQPTLGVATVKDEITMVNAPWSSLFADDTSSELSDLSDSLDLDDVLQRIVKRKRPKLLLLPRNTRSSSRNMIHNRVGTPILDQEPEEGMIENPRKPGDYMTSKSRLSGKDSKWVECQTCDNQFVQEDSHRGTRKECPRCERHSKLYGYPWPKTDREGKHDTEERVLDHRTIHRFVDPEEEKEIKKEKPKRKFREEIMERFSTPRSGRDSSMSMEVESGRNRRRTRFTM